MSPRPWEVLSHSSFWLAGSSTVLEEGPSGPDQGLELHGSCLDHGHRKEFPWAWAGFPMAETLETPGYGIFPAWNMDRVCDLWAMVEPWAVTHHAPLCPHWPHAQLKETPVVIWCLASLDSVYFPVQTGQRQQEEKGADSDCSESPTLPRQPICG